MTPREPDRYEAKAREVLKGAGYVDFHWLVKPIAAALRQAADEALEWAAREAEALSSNYDKERAEIADGIADAIRALASPAAAPAAETGPGMAECERCPGLPPWHEGKCAAAPAAETQASGPWRCYGGCGKPLEAHRCTQPFEDSSGCDRCAACALSDTCRRIAQRRMCKCGHLFTDHSNSDNHHGCSRCRCSNPVPPSEPVAPAPSDAEKRIAELEGLLHHALDVISPYESTLWQEIHSALNSKKEKK